MSEKGALARLPGLGSGRGMTTSRLSTTSVARPPAVDQAEREWLQRRARLLAWAGNVWHLAEFAVAVGAGIAASSIALVGFGIDSLIEVLAASVVVWLFTGRRLHSETAERRAQQLIALSFFALAA